MRYPVHESDTGSFQELVRRGDLEFGQLSILEIAPGCSRGGHYHKRKHEWFCCTEGDCRFSLVRKGKEQTSTLHGNPDYREFVEVPPFVGHVLANNNAVDRCVLLIISSELFDPDDPDTFTLEETR